MAGRTVTAIIVVILLVVAGIWAFGRGDGYIAGNNATTTDNTSGIGGADEGFDPLDVFNEDTNTSTSTDEEPLFNDKG